MSYFSLFMFCDVYFDVVKWKYKFDSYSQDENRSVTMTVFYCAEEIRLWSK